MYPRLTRTVRLSILLVASALFVFSPVYGQGENPVDLVNPFVGTFPSSTVLDDILTNESLASGNTMPGAKLPWGLASVNPRTGFDPYKWERYGSFSTLETGYLHGDPYLYGFSQLNLSGVGCGDWGQILIVPTTGFLQPNLFQNKSRYSQEEASVGYYRSVLDWYGIKAEGTATERSTIMRLSYQKGGMANVITDLYHAMAKARDAAITKLSATVIEGWILNGGLCGTSSRQKVFFTIELSREASEVGFIKDGNFGSGLYGASGTELSAYWRLPVEAGEQLFVKTGLSFVSIENARLNLATEIPEWNFDQHHEHARSQWAEVLGKIEVEGGTREQRVMFYTGLYHSLMHPNIFQDVNGEYLTIETRRVDSLKAGQQNQYTVFSLWDTFRTVHPLLTLLYPDRQLDMVRTMVDHAEQHGELTFWELGASETYIMEGDPANMVIADTYLKGLTDFDAERALQAMVDRSTLGGETGKRKQLEAYLDLGYVPYDYDGGGTSVSLEYYYADWAAGRLAEALGKRKVQQSFDARAAKFLSVFDDETGFVRPRLSNGEWYGPFHPDTMYHSVSIYPNGGPGFVEGNAWQYSFYMPHATEKLIKHLGKESFIAKLNAAFEEDGRFVLYNQPDMAYPWLYNYVAGEEWRTQAKTRELLDYYFSAEAGGIPGNDDAGTLSAWLVWASMGLYPDRPGSPVYQIGSPVFDRITIHLDEQHYPGKSFTIFTANNSPDSPYLERMELNGQPYKGFTLDHETIVAGGELRLYMSKSPNP